MQQPAPWREVVWRSRLPLTVIDAQRERRANRPPPGGYLAPVDPYAPDGWLCAVAEERARHIVQLVAGLPFMVTAEWLNGALLGLEARPFDIPKGGASEDELHGMVRRACCPLWWRRQVRRAATRKREAQAQAAGLVCVRRFPYVTDETVKRRGEQAARNRLMLENTEIMSEEGEIITLWQAVEASNSNKAIRRGELMTRIRGCEEWATARGLVGVFTTNTLPSRFHSALFKGGKNPEFSGATPKDGQAWLCAAWARLRAKLARVKLPIMGFRVAEPHHDGCPHWHMLLWMDAGRVEEFAGLLRAEWLKDGGDEKGAAEYRVKLEAIDPKKGGAVAYVAKYIAKNIDDAGAVGVEGHRDEFGGEQLDLIDGDGGKARRVEAWAAAWGIRQFQAIGQPPVTVWREARRCKPADLRGAASPAVRAMGEAVNRDGERRACWRGYVDAQGGCMRGRDYVVGIAKETEERAGRYGPVVAERLLGVFDRATPGAVVSSNRKVWREPSAWAELAEVLEARAYLREFAPANEGIRIAGSEAARPWTRVNNCTGPKLQTWREAIDLGPNDWDEPGGSGQFEDLEPWKTINANTLRDCWRM